MRGGAKFGYIYTKSDFWTFFSNSRWRTVLVPFSVINDVIITSLLRLKIFHVSGNFLISYQSLYYL